MSLTVSGLIPKVNVFRKDLEKERSIYAIQEAVRKVCRQTMLAQEVLVNVSAGTTEVTLTPTTGYSINRVHKVELLDTQGNFRVLGEANQVRIDGTDSLQDAVNGVPSVYTYVGNAKIHLYPSPAAVTVGALVIGKTYTILTVGTTSFIGIGAASNTVGISFVATGVGSGTGTVTQMLKVTISEIPTGEIETILLPDEAEDCIVAGALAFIMMQPGTGQNMQFAMNREVLHNRELGALKATAILGQSGRLRVIPQVLGGSRKNFVDYRRF